MKNADVIRAMNDEELANFLAGRTPEDCGDCVACDVCRIGNTCLDAISKWIKMDTAK